MTLQPALVYGALRSGSTLLRLMVNGNPRLHCPGEVDFLFDHLHRDRDGWRYDRDALGRDRIYRNSILHLPDGIDGIDALDAMIGQIGGGERCAVLMVHRGMEKIAALLPDLAVIHLKRDPRDVARSSIGMGWAGNVYHGAGHWIATEQSWNAGHGGLRRAPLDLFYEDLIPQPERELRRLCDFLGVDYDPAMLDYARTSTYAAPDPSLVSQWKTRQSPHQIGLIEARLGRMLADYGYEPSGHPPVAPGPAGRFRLAVQNRLYRFRFAVKRHGLGTVLQHRIARRLGLGSLEHAAQRRIDEITQSHVK